MSVIPLPLRDAPVERQTGLPTVMLVGNPNAGKTTLFNALTGLRAKTANFPGTTVEHRSANLIHNGTTCRLVDLPGLYGLEASSPEERIAEDAITGRLSGVAAPDAVVLVLDATHLERNLFLAGRVRELGVPAVAVLTLTDAAHKQGVRIDFERLRAELGCPVVPVAARRGHGIDKLRDAIHDALQPAAEGEAKCDSLVCGTCGGCPYAARYDWARGVTGRCVAEADRPPGRATEAIDRVLTHPVVGILAFAAVMAAMFVMLYVIAQYPMDWIDRGFSATGAVVGPLLPDGMLRSLVVDGILAGVGGVLVFLPQIVILFFFIALLEDTGYLARAAFVMDRLMRRFGLPGRAFVPMLSAHACAVPAIFSTRIIEDHRDRLITMLVLPFMTCSARLPVYAMVIALLFADNPLAAGLLLAGAYFMGLAAALGASVVMRRTVVPGQARPLVIELPDYRLPSLKNALLASGDRAMIFLKKVGGIILIASVVMWLAANFPRLPQDAAPVAGRTVAQQQLEYSVAGRVGRALEPVFAPLGFDWQINVGVLGSFVARETIVPTLAIVYGLGEDAIDDQTTFGDSLKNQTRIDGTPVFTAATSLSLLVFYILAMQCLSTTAAMRRETGGWKWPLFQVAYMTVLAYVAAMVTYQAVSMV